jgi:hypothetical protein
METNLKQLIETYKESLSAIFESFGVDQGYGELDDQTDSFFIKYEDCIYFQTEDPEDSDVEELAYCNDILGSYENDTHYMIYVDNGCGDKFYQIFDKSKQLNHLTNETC